MRATCPEHARYNLGCPHCWRARDAAAKLSLAPATGSANNLEWAERQLMKLRDKETDPNFRALWSAAASIARERIAVKDPNNRGQGSEQLMKTILLHRLIGRFWFRCPQCHRMKFGILKRMWNSGAWRVCRKCDDETRSEE